LTDKDEAFVIDFNVDASLVQDFTRDVHAAESAEFSEDQHRLFNWPIPGAGAAGAHRAAAGTVLFDAVYLSAHDMLARSRAQGDDSSDRRRGRSSKLKIKDAIEAAQKADAIVYVLLCADRGFYGGMGYSGEYDMRKLTEATGGRVINVGNKFDKLRDAFDQIAAELRSQYNIGLSRPIRSSMEPTARSRSRTTGYKIQARAGITPDGRKISSCGAGTPARCF